MAESTATADPTAAGPHRPASPAMLEHMFFVQLDPPRDRAGLRRAAWDLWLAGLAAEGPERDRLLERTPHDPSGLPPGWRSTSGGGYPVPDWYLQGRRSRGVKLEESQQLVAGFHPGTTDRRAISTTDPRLNPTALSRVFGAAERMVALGSQTCGACLNFGEMTPHGWAQTSARHVHADAVVDAERGQASCGLSFWHVRRHFRACGLWQSRNLPLGAR